MAPPKPPVIHGKYRTYQCHGCRCDLCRAANAKRARDNYARKHTRPLGEPVRDRDGEIHPSHSAAAAALGVARQTISYHLSRHGDLTRLGGKRGGLNLHGKRIELMGRSWRSMSALARELHVTRATVVYWIDHGQRDKILAALMKADAIRAEAERKARVAA
jgi:hypothetical protein